MSAQGLTYEEALSAYFDAIPDAMQPRRSGSFRDKRGRWILRNVRGFLAYVTSRGLVLDQRFRRIDSEVDAWVAERIAESRGGAA